MTDAAQLIPQGKYNRLRWIDLFKETNDEEEKDADEIAKYVVDKCGLIPSVNKDGFI